MGLALIVIGIVVALLLSWPVGILLVVVGVVLLFIPATPYSYGWYRGRRRGPQ